MSITQRIREFKQSVTRLTGDADSLVSIKLDDAAFGKLVFEHVKEDQGDVFPYVNRVEVAGVLVLRADAQDIQRREAHKHAKG